MPLDQSGPPIARALETPFLKKAGVTAKLLLHTPATPFYRKKSPPWTSATPGVHGLADHWLK